MQPTRRRAIAALALALAATTAHAHHGWRWTTGGQIEVSGIIESARLGNPHGVLTLTVEDETWTVEVGQPWRNARAGLTDAMLSPGVELVVAGEPAADVSQRLVKAISLWVDGNRYDLYPERT